MNLHRARDTAGCVPRLTANSAAVLTKRYLIKDDNRRVIESPAELFLRVARHIAAAENNYRSEESAEEIEQGFYSMMCRLEFLPNSPTMMNAGTYFGQLSACFVLPVEDSIDGIFRSLSNMARIHQTGGGTGFNFSHLRPRGDMLSTTKGEASGPISFMQIFDKATAVIVQGGRRRGANMGILRCDHPDISEFIGSKLQKGMLSNFNISVGVTDKFMEAVLSKGYLALTNPRTHKVTGRIKATELFHRIVDAAWRTGDPGLIFLDEINRKNPTPNIGKLEATNPCGELPLLPYESCNLGSINLAKFVKNGKVEWERLRQIVHLGVRFLDNVIDANKFPTPEIKKITSANRKIGLGVMGFADMLIELGIPYTSKGAVIFGGKLMNFIQTESLRASENLARTRGLFPNFRGSMYEKKGYRVRNATVNTIAPTGTISIIAGCSSGIEPLFAISFVRNVLSGTRLIEINPSFERCAKERSFYSRGLIDRIARQGSLKNIRGVPEDVKRIYITAFDCPAEQHIRIQTAFQKFTDNSVSKTINLPAQAAIADVRKIYLAAYKLGCKGITIYRYGSRAEQVLSFAKKNITADPEYSGGCASGACPF